MADTADIPVILAVRPQGSSLTLAAQVRGLLEFRSPSHIAGLLLNSCKPPLYAHLKPILERETGLPVLGYLPPMEKAALPSRHLGLLTAGEVMDLSTRFEAIGGQLEKTADLGPWRRRWRSQRSGRTVSRPGVPLLWPGTRPSASAMRTTWTSCGRTGRNWNFSVPSVTRAFRRAWTASTCRGGYPELYARQLSENVSMRESVRQAVAAGLPTVAECGGFLYLQKALEDKQGASWPMAGVLPGAGYRTGSLQRFGYKELNAEGDSLLFRREETVPVHEFHYWDCTQPGPMLTETMYAAFPHLHFGGEIPLAERFVEGAVKWREKHER